MRTTATTAPLPRAVPVSPARPVDAVGGAPQEVRPAPAEHSPSGAGTPPLADDDALRAWARRDPALATRWLATAGPSLKRDVVLEIVCLEVVQYDPVEAIAIADQFGYPGMSLRENLVTQWAERDVGGAKAYAAKIDRGPERDRLLARIAFAWSKSNPAAAAHLVVDEIPAGQLHDEAAFSVLHQWAQQQPVPAHDWILSFPDGALRERALAEWELAQQARQ